MKKGYINTKRFLITFTIYIIIFLDFKLILLCFPFKYKGDKSN
jgi:hypothetical protein